MEQCGKNARKKKTGAVCYQLSPALAGAKERVMSTTVTHAHTRLSC
jgi:hypothetical protein